MGIFSELPLREYTVPAMPQLWKDTKQEPEEVGEFETQFLHESRSRSDVFRVEVTTCLAVSQHGR